LNRIGPGGGRTYGFVEKPDCDDRFLDLLKADRKLFGSEPFPFRGQKVVEKLRRLRISKSGAAAGLYSGEIHAAGESILLRAAIQRQGGDRPPAGSAACCSLVQGSVSGTRSFRLQRSLDRDSQGKQNRLRAMGRRRSISHRSLAIRFRQRAP